MQAGCARALEPRACVVAEQSTRGGGHSLGQNPGSALPSTLPKPTVSAGGSWAPRLSFHVPPLISPH